MNMLGSAKFSQCFILALLFGLTCHAGTINGRVVSVMDGDTVTVLTADKVQHKIRLSEIEAPDYAAAPVWRKTAHSNRWAGYLNAQHWVLHLARDSVQDQVRAKVWGGAC